MGACRVAGAIFAPFSWAVALGWLYKADLWVLQTAQVYPSGFLPAVSGVFSFFGDVEIAASAFSLLLAALFWCGRRAFAGRLLVVFVTTALVELAMKFYLPQQPIPEGSVWLEDFAPLVVAKFPYPYPSGRMLRAVILFGALYVCLKTGW